jgi:hypothetical protein
MKASKGEIMRAFRRLGAIAIATGATIIALAVGDLSRVRIADGSIPVVRADGGSIVGTWIITVRVNTPPGAPPFIFTELGSFNPGGTFIDTIGIAHSSQNPFLVGPFAPLAADFSDGFGTWKQLGEDSNQFAATFKRLILAGANTPTSVYGSFFPGENVGVAGVQLVATLQHGENGDTLTGPFTFQLTDLSGQVVFAASGTFAATRLKIEPLATP